MTRPSYDPLRPPAPRFPAHRFAAAGIGDAATAVLAEQYEGMDYDQRVRFVRDVTRVPNEELARRYADGNDAGANPVMLTPQELADLHKADELKKAAAGAGLSASGTKVEVATRLLEAGKADALPPAPVVEPPTAPPVPDAPSAPQTPEGAPPVPEAPGTPAEPTAATTAPAEAAPAPTDPAAAPADAASAPQTAPDAPVQPDTQAPAPDAASAPQAAPTTPAAPADGTATPDGGTPA